MGARRVLSDMRLLQTRTGEILMTPLQQVYSVYGNTENATLGRFGLLRLPKTDTSLS